MAWPAATLLVGDIIRRDRFRRSTAAAVTALVRQGRRPPDYCVLAAATIMLIPFICLAVLMPYAGSPAFAGLARPSSLVLFLTMGLVYGFCVGVLCGLLFRCLRASAVVALSVSLLLAAIWLPALLHGRLAHLAGAWTAHPVLLASTPLLLRPWAAGRIALWTTVKRLTPFVTRIGLFDRGWLMVSGIRDTQYPRESGLGGVSSDAAYRERKQRRRTDA